MKELTTQEKAKRFDEALEKARRYYDEYVSRDNILYVEDMEDMFPELKEIGVSEDERIKGAIIEHLRDNNLTEWASWLEKQGEHKETLCDKCKKEQPSHSCQDITALGRCAVEHEQKTADKVYIPMSLDEAIEHCKKKSCDNTPCALEHKQLEKWLTELKELKEQNNAWSEEDNMMIEETLYFLREYQQSNRCKDENGMQNSVSCEKWLKSLKQRLF